MTIIEKNSDFVTLINSFTVDQSKQRILIDMLIEATEQIMKKQEGFISANIHRSLDGTAVVNYAQWESKDAFEKMLNNPQAQIHMNDILNVAKSDGRLYEVVFTE
ncbi:antibiotic biosynthesis monooxygenase family protein [Candidatus Nitrosocosmicus arcticus]|uniref:Tetracenomycin-F1 monooxygenase n=1 Tax=Candidatus Nitrosocosmicus arcticus TaxID=2035267 RepID=A0A557SRG5_9ARCH|nr:antibiotic biosynthesis monooxygenase family protein [Candidatus Nitrosocosmicus arcticus]MBA2267708.1 antibiotic biosynthesis monooxygenase [Nitrosopumilus sp.]TVP39188.1 Tetracenomycin-F1 monooxygenase [Candidatus Nitrosocosmicus arcticus]